MFISPYERPNDVALPFAQAWHTDRDPAIPRIGQPRTDSVSRMLPPWLGLGLGCAAGESCGGMLAQLGTLLQQLGSLLSHIFSGSNSSVGDNERHYQTAKGGSVGDPHLSFNDAHWDSMTSHADLLHSDSIPGGFQLSTQVTQPNANGVTLNRQATIETNYGLTTVSLDKDGNATIVDNGRTVNIAPGTTTQLANGETITRNQDGSMKVVCANDSGGQITTNLSLNGQGIDVNVDATNVDLAGDLTRHDPDSVLTTF